MKRNSLGIRACNPVIGCTINCPWCRSRPNAIQRKLTDNFRVPTFHERRTRMFPTNNSAIFDLCTMSDLSDWKNDWIRTVFNAMDANPQHIYLLSTFRPGRIILDSYAKEFLERSPNVWIGTTVMVKSDLERIEALMWNVPARHFYVNFEPLLAHLGDFDVSGIDWLHIGNLTGPFGKFYPTHKEWILNVAAEGRYYNIPTTMSESIRPIVGSKNFVFMDPFHQTKGDRTNVDRNPAQDDRVPEGQAHRSDDRCEGADGLLRSELRDP